MKQVIAIIACILVSVSSFGFEVAYSANAERELESAIAANAGLVKLVDSMAIAIDKSKSKAILEAYAKVRSVLFYKYPKAEENPYRATIGYDSGETLKGITGRIDPARSKSVAVDFLKNVMPDVLGEGEAIKILYVREDYGADQEKDERGAVAETVNVKTFSYSVRIGRTLFGIPIYNSFAEIAIDAATYDVVAFDLTNWKPVTAVNRENLAVIKQATFADAIAKRLAGQQKANPLVKQVVVDNVIPGWVFDDADSSLVPSFVHYGFVDEADEKGVLVQKKYSFLETIGNISAAGKKEVFEEEIFSGKMDIEAEPVIEKE